MTLVITLNLVMFSMPYYFFLDSSRISFANDPSVTFDVDKLYFAVIAFANVGK